MNRKNYFTMPICKLHDSNMNSRLIYTNYRNFLCAILLSLITQLHISVYHASTYIFIFALLLVFMKFTRHNGRYCMSLIAKVILIIDTINRINCPLRFTSVMVLLIIPNIFNQMIALSNTKDAKLKMFFVSFLVILIQLVLFLYFNFAIMRFILDVPIYLINLICYMLIERAAQNAENVKYWVFYFAFTIPASLTCLIIGLNISILHGNWILNKTLFFDQLGLWINHYLLVFRNCGL